MVLNKNYYLNCKYIFKNFYSTNIPFIVILFLGITSPFISNISLIPNVTLPGKANTTLELLFATIPSGLAVIPNCVEPLLG